MATPRLSMHKNREILRQKWALGRTHRDVAKSVGVSVGVVAKTLERAATAELDWEAVQALSDDALAVRLYGDAGDRPAPERPLPDFAELHIERQRKGVTLQLLHLEYLEKHPGGYRYTQFCDYYRKWLKRQRLSMKIEHRPGDKAFLDYSGAKLYLTDPKTGEHTPVELFVSALGVSGYIFAEASPSQSGPHFIESNIHMLEYYGGVPNALVPDQLRSAVARPCRYDPKIQRTYEALARHYGTTVLPARPRKPKDKAKAEVSVQIAQRWILARLRNERFATIVELGARIDEFLEVINNRVMKRYGKSRRELFELVDKPALRSLPRDRFEAFEWKAARVNIDYHVEVDGHYYSVPYALVGEVVEARYTASTVELVHKERRVAAHVRSYNRGAFTTIPEHMPRSHREAREWSPGRLIRWASESGPSVREFVETILRERPHPEHGYRACLGILRLGKKYGTERLDAACARGLRVGARSYRNIASILKTGLDRRPLPGPLPEAAPASAPLLHENIRGPRHYT